MRRSNMRLCVKRGFWKRNVEAHEIDMVTTAILWVPDKSIQRTLAVAYGKKEKTFYAKSCIYPDARRGRLIVKHQIVS